MSHPFGDRLSQHLHRKHGLSQAKLAAMLGNEAQTVALWERRGGQPKIADRFMPAREVRAIIGVSRTTLHVWTKAGEFPSPKKMVGNRVAWLASDVKQWMANRVANRAAA